MRKFLASTTLILLIASGPETVGSEVDHAECATVGEKCAFGTSAGNPDIAAKTKLKGKVILSADNGMLSKTAGTPIGGIIVKGGKNPGGQMRKGINQAGIKRGIAPEDCSEPLIVEGEPSCPEEKIIRSKHKTKSKWKN